MIFKKLVYCLRNTRMRLVPTRRRNRPHRADHHHFRRQHPRGHSVERFDRSCNPRSQGYGNPARRRYMGGRIGVEMDDPHERTHEPFFNTPKNFYR